MSEHRIGTVTHFFNRIRVATVRLEAPVKVGDRVHIKGRTREFAARVKSMQLNHQPVERAEAGQEVGIRVPKRAHEGDVVLRVEGAGPGWLSRLLGRWAGP